MFDLLRKMLTGQNQFASGGLLLMIIGGLSVYLRAVPRRVWEWLIGQTTLMITVKDDDVAFVWAKEWFREQKFLRRVRRVDLDTTLRGSALSLIPAPGRHWFWRRGRPYWIYFYRSEETKGWAPKRVEQLTFMTIGRNQRVLQQLVDEIAACHRKNMRVKSYLYTYSDGWTKVESYAPRRLDSVILEPGEKEHLIQDIIKFRSSKQRYATLGVPYHRGYLLYGPPGTGKTSLVSALAAKFGMSIYAVNLNEFSDRSLGNAINDVPENSIVLFEDIDCMRTGKARGNTGPMSNENPLGTPEQKEKLADLLGVTLSGLLNVLDGFYAPANVLFVMTTNHIGVLDTALLRPGRIDYRLYMGKATDRQKVELYRRFFPETSEFEAQEFVESHPSVETMADFQGVLLGLKREHESWELAESNV
jgi:chaperone BCS1